MKQNVTDHSFLVKKIKLYYFRKKIQIVSDKGTYVVYPIKFLI